MSEGRLTSWNTISISWVQVAHRPKIAAFRVSFFSLLLKTACFSIHCKVRSDTSFSQQNKVYSSLVIQGTFEEKDTGNGTANIVTKTSRKWGELILPNVWLHILIGKKTPQNLPLIKPKETTIPIKKNSFTVALKTVVCSSTRSFSCTEEPVQGKRVKAGSERLSSL